jgi:hypothetical protein
MEVKFGCKIWKTRFKQDYAQLLIGKGSWCHLVMNGVKNQMKQRLEVHVPLTHFLEFLSFEFTQIYGRKLGFYGWFMLLEVFGSLCDQEFEVWWWF